MAGASPAARTMAQPIRCVKLILRGASCSFSAVRMAARVTTGTSRKLVAVGTASEAVMFRARREAGPLIGVAPGGKAGSAGGSGSVAGAGAGVSVGRWRRGRGGGLLPVPRGRSGRRGGTGRRRDRATLEQRAPLAVNGGGIAAELLVQLGHVARVDGVDGVERLLDLG